MMLKRAGRGHDPAGVIATPTAGLALECPQCPLPGKNIPIDWEEATEAKKYVVCTHTPLARTNHGLADFLQLNSSVKTPAFE